jgi:hypothetical protein
VVDPLIHTVVAERPVDRLDGRHLLDARHAPRGEEVHDDRRTGQQVAQCGIGVVVQ